MSARAIIHGVRVFVKQFLCRHEDMELYVDVADGSLVQIQVCAHCGWTNYHPRVW